MFHNLTGYDSHFIIKEIASNAILDGRTTLIAQNKECYIFFTKHITGSIINFRFLDSFRFTASSLDKLASYLNDTPILKNIFNTLSEDKLRLLQRKGVFPYEYITNLSRLDDKKLPDKHLFYSKLYEKHITDQA